MIETLPNRFPERPYRVELSHPEFTSICPLTRARLRGANDSLRPRREAAGAEVAARLPDRLPRAKDPAGEVVNTVLDEVVASAQPRFAEVEGVFNVRGGMTTHAVACSGEDPTA